jgi:hypothetical protein
MRRPALTAIFLFAALVARADILTYSFSCITPSNPAACAIGEAQLFMDVVGNGQSVQIGDDTRSPAANQVLFRFRNIGPLESVIAAIYFDQPHLSPLFQGIAAIYGMTGVAFSVVEDNPCNLPGGNSLSPAFDEDFCATADPPPSKKGVDPGEAVGLALTLQSGVDWDAVIGALDSAALRVGLHVLSFPDGSSASFVNDGVVPEPAAILLVGSVLLILGRRLRKPA